MACFARPGEGLLPSPAELRNPAKNLNRKLKLWLLKQQNVLAEEMAQTFHGIFQWCRKKKSLVTTRVCNKQGPEVSKS